MPTAMSQFASACLHRARVSATLMAMGHTVPAAILLAFSAGALTDSLH